MTIFCLFINHICRKDKSNILNLVKVEEDCPAKGVS